MSNRDNFGVSQRNKNKTGFRPVYDSSKPKLDKLLKRVPKLEKVQESVPKVEKEC